MKQFKLTQLIKFYGTLIIIIFGFCVTAFNVYENYKNYKKVSSEFVSNILNSKKELAKNIVLQTVSMINKTSEDSISLAYKKAKQHVYLAYNIVNNLYQKLKDKFKTSDIERIIIEAIRNIKFSSTSDYFFIVKTDGKVLLNSAYPSFEGRNFYNLKDNEGKYILKEMAEIAIKKGEGFYSYKWFKPGNGKNYYKKVSFIKYFKPLNFFIGNGIYLKEISKSIQEDLINKISGMRYGKQGYVFINKFDGTALITNGKIVKGNKKLWELFKNQSRREEVKRIFQMELETVENGKNGFMICNWEKLRPPHKLTKMLVYLYPIAKWQWIVGSGIFLDDVEGFLTKEKTKMFNTLLKNIYFLTLMTLCFLGIFLILINKFGNLIDVEFERFRNYFENAIKNNTTIDESNIKFHRLRLFAHYANRILKEKFELSKKLEEEKEKLEITLNSVNDAIISTDLNKKVDLMNPVAEKLTGWDMEDAKGKNILDILKCNDSSSYETIKGAVNRVLKYGVVVKFLNYLYLTSKNGNKFYISGSIAPIKDNNGKIFGMVLVFQDVTEKLMQEKHLIKAEKLQALGILAGGIAHDFNNILTGISGNISLLKIDIKNGEFDIDKVDQRLNKIEHSIKRAIHLTQQLLTFSKGGEIVKENFNLKELIENTVEFNLAGSNIKAIYRYNVENFDFLGDKGQLSHVISNLVINSKQAMPHGGKIYISVDRQINPKIEGKTVKGDFFRITIKDQGEGIKKEILDKIFDPFFTTKKDGTGLGLSIVHSIVKKHGGYITVDSEYGKGTEFQIFLPIQDNDKNYQNLKKKEKFSIKKIRNVLVVDDEEDILEIMKEMFKVLNIRCTTVKNGTDALKLLKKEDFDLIITDLTIPGDKGGKEIISEIKKINPNVKVIVSSGYSEDDVISNYKKYGFDGKIKKPFTIDDLKKEIYRIF